MTELREQRDALYEKVKEVTTDPVKYAKDHGWNGKYKMFPEKEDSDYELSGFVAQAGCGGMGCWSDRMERHYACMYIESLELGHDER